MTFDLQRLRALKDRVAVVGVGASEQGNLPDLDEYTLACRALSDALDDCGLGYDDIDGLFVNGPGSISFVRFGEMLGIDPVVGGNFSVGGPAIGPLIHHAAMLLETGACRCVALVYGNASRNEGRQFGGMTVYNPAQEYANAFFYYGLTSPGAASAFQARIHFETYGTTSRQLGAVAVTQRAHARLNPQAIMRDPLTIEQHQASRYVCEPLHLYDYCLINDGGVALILTTADRARDLRQRPVLIKGIGRQDTYRCSSLPNWALWRDTLPRCADMAFSTAEVDRSDVDAVMIYDSFSINIWIALETFGFCGEGEAGDYTQDGRISLGGDLPVNTHGGHLSESYMQGWLHQVEAVRQLRGVCGPRQVEDARIIPYICRANIGSAIIYGTD
ncbi:MAG: thiolase family protein [Lautropia sp.]